jgi:hypothetical protein
VTGANKIIIIRSSSNNQYSNFDDNNYWQHVGLKSANSLQDKSWSIQINYCILNCDSASDTNEVITEL